MIKIENGQIGFDKKLLLCEINTYVPSCKLTIVIGPNGAGKTSLINILAGKTRLNSGVITNDFKNTILIPQKTYFPEGITLFDYLSSIFFYSKWKWRISLEEKEQIFKIMKELNLSDKAELPVEKLSGGEQQLANIALSILSNSDFMILDEPLANLDMHNQVLILNMLKKLTQKGITIVVVMHDINFAAKYGDHFIIVSREGCTISGNREETLTPENLSNAYNYKFKVVEVEEDIFIQPNI